MDNYLCNRIRKVYNLNGIWKFTFLGENFNLNDIDINNINTTTEPIPVPSAFDAMPAYEGKRGTAVYRTYVNITPDTVGRIRFHGVGMWCRIYVDRKLVKEHSGAYIGFWCDVPASSNKKREITVIVDNRFDFHRSPLQEKFFDFYNYGGILRGVEWHEVSKTFIDALFVKIINYQTGEITANLRLNGNIPELIDIKVSINEGDWISFQNLKLSNNTVSVNLNVPDSKPWSPDSPSLNTLNVRIKEDDIIVRFGLREVAVKGSEILINGNPLKLLGYCRHEAHPQFGPALPLQQLVADLQLMKEMGCNFIRGSHYPQDQRFLDLCDELGFLVFEETTGWGQGERQFTDQHFIDAQVDQTRNMIETGMNHPSVIIHGFLNEGASNEESSRFIYEKLINLIRKTDPSRLVTYASNKPMDDLFFDKVDIISINTYPGWYSDDKTSGRPLYEIVPYINKYIESIDSKCIIKKPIILSEIGAGAIYGWHDPLHTLWSEEYQADCLKIICNEVVKNKRISGVSLWQFCDTRTYTGSLALFRPRAFNNKGTFDEYRRPKMAKQIVQSIFTNFKQKV